MRRLHFGLLGVIRHHGHVVSQVETQMELEPQRVASIFARAFGVVAVFVPADNQDVHVTWGRLLAERRRRGKSDWRARQRRALTHAFCSLHPRFKCRQFGRAVRPRLALPEHDDSLDLEVTWRFRGLDDVAVA